ncbi:MAG: N-formylglutamate amidohydrolase [Pseudomonadota bacterium]
MASATIPSETHEPQVINPTGSHRIVLICEHASNRVPDRFSRLGLDDAALQAHIAWDPGAFETAHRMSEILDAPLVYSTVSRLVYDCNRPPEATSAIPEKSETTDIPGNRNLSAEAWQQRVDAYYKPFEALVNNVIENRPNDTVLVTIHSFTPNYFGKKRDVEIGILHDRDRRLADAILDIADEEHIARNEPYGPEDGVTHTLKHHALSRDLLNVMIEVRNDLITTPRQCEAMAGKLVSWLDTSLVSMQKGNANA